VSPLSGRLTGGRYAQPEGSIQDHNSNFNSELSVRIRNEVFGEDIGQNSWTTAKEQIGFAKKSGLRSESHLLEVGCGAGGPALFLAKTAGVTVCESARKLTHPLALNINPTELP
jgi:hypothetical protein